MNPLLLVTLCLGAGPVLDPIKGGEVTAGDRALLPSGRHLGSVADIWFVQIVNMQIDGAGMAQLDPLYLSSHGRSRTQMHFLLNGVDISDPARPGRPLLEVPFELWDRLRYRSLWTEAPGFQWHVDLQQPKLEARARAGTGLPLGGGTWVPAGFMDREPATAHGATGERRELRNPIEVDAQLSLASSGASLRTHVHHQNQGRRYPTLVGTQDLAERTTVFLGSALRVGGVPVQIIGLWQRKLRTHEGAEFRWPKAYTLRTQGQAFVALAKAELWRQGQVALEARALLGLRVDDERLADDTRLVTDLEEEWMWLARPRWGERLERSKVGAGLHANLVDPFGLELDLQVAHASITSRAQIPGGRVGETYSRGASDPSQAGVYQTVYAPAGRAEEWLRSARLSAEWGRTFGALTLRGTVGLSHGALGVPGATRLGYWTPAAGFAARQTLGASELFFVVRREPVDLTSQVAAFLDPARPSGHRYAWLDDGDRIPEPGEQGQLLARTGGLYHQARPGVRRPTSNHFALGFWSPIFGSFRATVSAIGRWLVDPYTVRLQGPAPDGYRRIDMADPGGMDGLGQQQGQPAPTMAAYARDRATFGTESYVLTNDPQPAFYVGTELQVLTVDDGWWFVNFGGAGYWNVGTGGGFGPFPDRNDAGIIHESSADPNQRINKRGRFDQDRSFALHLLAGVRPLQLDRALSLATAIRYRDGQPFTRVVVASDLPQGPTALMAVHRGAPRHTFHLYVDLRARYDLVLRPWRLSLLLDVFNVLGSGTEIVEDPRTGPSFRTSLEMVPGRALFFAVELAWGEGEASRPLAAATEAPLSSGSPDAGSLGCGSSRHCLRRSHSSMCADRCDRQEPGRATR